MLSLKTADSRGSISMRKRICIRTTLGITALASDGMYRVIPLESMEKAATPTQKIDQYMKLTYFAESSNDCDDGENEKRAITDTVYNRASLNKSY